MKKIKLNTLLIATSLSTLTVAMDVPPSRENAFSNNSVTNVTQRKLSNASVLEGKVAVLSLEGKSPTISSVSRDVVKVIAGYMKPFKVQMQVNTTDANLLETINSLSEENQSMVSELNLDGCTQITSEALIAVVSKCPNLTSLNLTSCYNIFSEALIAVVSKCPNLTSLSLGTCIRITSEALIEVIEKCENLTKLDLSYCRLIAPEALIEIAAKCRNLKTLSLFGCTQITPEALIAVAGLCPGLTDLNLAACLQVTPAVLIEVAARCRNLIKLNLFGCNQINREALLAVVEKCPYLKTLILHDYTPQIRDCVPELKTLRPVLQIII